LLRLCTVYLSSSLVACIHVIKTLDILIAQGACLIQALASSTFAIVLEAYELVGRWKLIAPSCSVYTRPFNTEGAAPTIGFIDWSINSLDGTILELFPLRVNAHRIVLLTGKNVVVTLMIYPRDVIG
jgi:hypothetical protein